MPTSQPWGGSEWAGTHMHTTQACEKQLLQRLRLPVFTVYAAADTAYCCLNSCKTHSRNVCCDSSESFLSLSGEDMFSVTVFRTVLLSGACSSWNKVLLKKTFWTPSPPLSNFKSSVKHKCMYFMESCRYGLFPKSRRRHLSLAKGNKYDWTDCVNRISIPTAPWPFTIHC